MKEEMKKESYECPVIKRQQVILEQVIAAGSKLKSSTGPAEHDWIEEEIDNGDIITF